MWDGVKYVCCLYDGLLVNWYKFSVDVLFCFMVVSVGVFIVVVLFIGMGDDGVCGLLELS